MKKRLHAITGPKKYAALFLLGAASALAMPPAGFFSVLLLTAPGFIWLTETAPTRFTSFLSGWTLGAGYFIFGLYWISAALFVDIDQWKWVLPLSLIVGPGLMGLYYGFIPLLARPFRDNADAHALVFATLWAATEYARGHLLTGFPWNLAGYAWDRILPVMQFSSLAGIYGLTLLTLLWAASPAFSRKLKIAAFLSFCVALGWGSARLWLHPTIASETTVRIVQANIPQNMKWDNDAEWRNFEKHLALTRSRGDPGPGVVVWPETAVMADLTLFPEISRLIALQMPPNSIGVLGTLRVTEEKSGPRFFNSVSVVDKKAHVLDVYDKHHLVPFGEYIPFRDKLNITPIAAAISGIGDFTPGTGPRTIRGVPGLPAASLLVCYEVIFPGQVADRKDRPDWMVNVTNDAWYGRTAGPYQHLAIARVRSIEEGLPLARAANTGISALTDPLGRIVAEQPLGTAGALDAALPRALPPTLYARRGDSVFWALLALISGYALLIFFRQKSQ